MESTYTTVRAEHYTLQSSALNVLKIGGCLIMKYERNHKVELQKKGNEQSVSRKTNGNWSINVWASISSKLLGLERSCFTSLEFGNYVGLSIVFVLIVFLSPSAVLAQAWQIEPSVTVEQSYNDNYSLTTESEAKVFTTRIAGGLTLKRITETIEFEGLVRADFVKLSGDTDFLDDTDDNQLLGFKASRKFERTKLGLDFLFLRDDLLRSQNVVEDPSDVTVGPDQSVDDGVVTVSVRRYRTELQPNFDYQLTERSNLGLRYRFNDTNYDDNELTRLTDFQRHSITGSLETQVTEKNTVLALLTGSRFDSDSGNTTDTVELQVGLSHDFDETTNVGFTLGGRHTEFDTATEDDSSNGFRSQIKSP